MHYPPTQWRSILAGLVVLGGAVAYGTLLD